MFATVIDSAVAEPHHDGLTAIPSNLIMSALGTLPPTDAAAPTSGAEPCPLGAEALGNLEPYARKLRSLEQTGSLTLARVLNRQVERTPAAGRLLPTIKP
jgi:hypothetical protein